TVSIPATVNGTSSSGMLSTETFTFPTDSIWKAKYSNLVFGCAFSNWNIPFAEGPGNVIAGVLGLNGVIHSMLVQLQERTKKRFSFCPSSLETPTLLQFGDASASM
ncbi:Xylanase inhibitor, N-terminal, partial [Parasponia andersonii]